MTEGNPTVEEARLNLWVAVDEHSVAQSERGAGNESHMSGCTCCCWDCEPVMDALIEAVRQEERERLGACLECGGGGVGLVRTGNAYEHFDQGDYAVVDCEACAGTGRVERGEE